MKLCEILCETLRRIFLFMRMLFQISQYLKFLLKSTNQHGVHSPFVFNLVTKCFYNKTHKPVSNTSKKEQLLQRVSEYLEIKNTLNIENLEPKSEKYASNVYDFIYFKNPDKAITLKHFESLLPTIHNDSVFVFNAIHTSKEIIELWEHIKKHPKVTVTIDTFILGFVFFRQEQAKEHFTIRV